MQNVNQVIILINLSCGQFLKKVNALIFSAFYLLRCKTSKNCLIAFHYLQLGLICCCLILSCKPEITKDKPLSEVAFTPIEEIDPNIYFATTKNKASDPNNELTELFRKKKAADMADTTKPRPFQQADLSPLENISHKQTWTPLEDIFTFDWSQLPTESLSTLSKTVKTRIIFDNSDLKVIELAVASGSILPLHAQATPSVYHILGGEGVVSVNNERANVYAGTSISFDSYDKKRVEVTSDIPLKILWFSWAPQGDKTYLESGYYLTGSNLHVQPMQAVLPERFSFWGASKSFELTDSSSSTIAGNTDFIKAQNSLWNQLEKTAFYPNTPTFKSAADIDFVDVVNLDPKSFFFAKDIQKLGDALKMLSRIAKIKSVFRVKRPDSGYDLNYSYLAWGPQSKYITHSHAICEFYYLLEGDVEYIIDGQSFHAVPGNFYFHPPYYDHEMRGLKEGVPFLSISGSWIPFGKRALFDKPFLLLEEIVEQDGSRFPDGFNFHDFEINDKLEYGVL